MSITEDSYNNNDIGTNGNEIIAYYVFLVLHPITN